MASFRQKIKNLAVKIYVSTAGSSLRQGESLAAEGRSAETVGMAPLLRRAAAEGAVLLKNDGTLPLKKKCAVFGRVQTDTFYTGYGSGGDVVKPYRVSILDGLEAHPRIEVDASLAQVYRAWSRDNPVDHGYWGNWPQHFPEMPLTEEILDGASRDSDTAVIVIGRAAGEERENELKKGSYYLTDDERAMLDAVTSRFSHTVIVLNIGSLIDFSWVTAYHQAISAILVVWQGGMETGNAVADLLAGDVNPSGKLTDTVAVRYDSYPSAKNFGNADKTVYEEDIYVGYRWFETFSKSDVLFPFGYGLSYTRFSVTAAATDLPDGGIRVNWRVENIGNRSGREVVQIYIKKPCGTLGNPSRELVAFCKTKTLDKGESQSGEMDIPVRMLSSYDSSLSAFVLQAGDYGVFAGTNVRGAVRIATLIRHTRIVEQLKEQCAPKSAFKVIAAQEEHGHNVSVSVPVPVSKKNLKAEIIDSLPQSFPITEDKGYLLKDVKQGKIGMEEFVAQFSLDELEAISRGDYVMDSPLGASGNAGVFGGVLPSLRSKGIPPVTATDGPSGIRLKCASSLIPIGTSLACTFDEQLVSELYAAIGEEMKERGSHVLLAPGMNLHRDPLCGRNFEYFSEDPLLSGKIAAAAVRGVQSVGVSACPKHFACNNQEFNRMHNNSCVSERALREIYLRGFEICVKEGKPQNIMTSYNKLNGVWAHYHFELIRGILRGEWEYRGNVMTDWWMRSARSPEFKKLKKNAYRVRAGVNLLMPGGSFLGRRKPDGSLLKSLGKKNGITLGELQRNAAEILQFIMNSDAFRREE